MADILLGNVKGPQGRQGETGATGAPGAAGADGAAATINVGTVSTSAYGTTAQVTNSGTESAAVFDFVIPQGRPGEETTRMSALTLDQVTASTASQPVPAVGESGSVVWGKVIKFFNDVKSALTNKINYSDCVANLTSTSGTLPLAASQGKALNDAKADKTTVDTLNNAVSALTTTVANTKLNRRVMTFVKTVPANSYASATVEARELSLDSAETLKFCNVHLTYYASSQDFQVGCEISYRIGDDNRTVIIGLFNTTSVQRNYSIQCETLASK